MEGFFAIEHAPVRGLGCHVSKIDKTIFSLGRPQEMIYESQVKLTHSPKEDLYYLRSSARRSKCRKGIPDDDIPNEVWRMILWPNKTYRERHVHV